MNDQSTAVTAIKPKSVLIDMATRYGMEPAAFEATVRATCMKPDKNGRVPSREEFAAFLLVAKEYNLNPLTKEIYAFSAKGGGIVPIVSVDGWISLVNSHKACDGFEFDMEHDAKGNLLSCTCRMYRKDRARPVAVTEYLAECIRNTEPWAMKHRMLRHKTLVQAARYAFGFSGVYDEDEGQKIAEPADKPNRVEDGEFTEVDALADVPPPPTEAKAVIDEIAAATADVDKVTGTFTEVQSADEVEADTFPGDKPASQQKADPISSGLADLPWHLDRKLSDNDRDLLMALKEALQQCTVVDEIEAEWETIALPAKDVVSVYVWDKAEDLKDEHIQRVNPRG